jgi:hypothetical protein
LLPLAQNCGRTNYIQNNLGNNGIGRKKVRQISKEKKKHRQHTSHEETNNNRRKTKSLHCPQLDHHDADGLAGYKDWRTAQTIMRRYKRPLISIF